MKSRLASLTDLDKCVGGNWERWWSSCFVRGGNDDDDDDNSDNLAMVMVLLKEKRKSLYVNISCIVFFFIIYR